MDKFQKENFTLLVVDDDPINLKIMENLLTKHGYKIEKAANGAELYDKLAEKSIDLILLDVVLPDTNGYDICRKLKSDSDYKTIPILFLTIKDDSRDIVRGFEAGGEDYILKPYNPMEVLARLDNQLKILLSQRIIKQYNQVLEEELQKRTEQLILSERRSAIGLMIQGVINNVQIPVDGLKTLIENFSDSIKQIEGVCLNKKDFVFKMINRNMMDLSETNYDLIKVHEQLNRIVHSLKSKMLLSNKPSGSISELNSIINEEILFMHLHYDFSNKFEKDLNLASQEIYVAADPQDTAQIFQNLIMNQMVLLAEEQRPLLSIKSGIDNNYGWIKIESNGSLSPEELNSYLCYREMNSENKLVSDTTMLYCCRTIKTYKGILDIVQESNKKVVTTVKLPLHLVK